MQLIRNSLRTATCTLLALSGSAAGAQGDWQIESAMMIYKEAGRTSVVEPVVSVTRNLPGGQSLGVKIILDGITGASPTGASATDHAQTITTASGRASTVHIGDVPLKRFHDKRASLDLAYSLPLTRTAKMSLGAHSSAETDYLSRGGTFTIDWDTPDRLTTFTAGVGGNFDLVQPIGGKPLGLVYASIPDRYGSGDKTSIDGLIGVTQILSPVWMAQLTYGQAHENGYLTEPYKVISEISTSGTTVDYFNEKRPDARTRRNVYLNSIYENDEDVIRFSYRYYWDDWGLKSNTFELKYRFDTDDDRYWEPLARYYSQTAVDFFTYGLIQGETLPNFATSDYRLGQMKTVTLGLKHGFPLQYGDFSWRVEYMRQSGDGFPGSAVGVQRIYDMFPAINIFVLTAGYSLTI